MRAADGAGSVCCAMAAAHSLCCVGWPGCAQGFKHSSALFIVRKKLVLCSGLLSHVLNFFLAMFFLTIRNYPLVHTLVLPWPAFTGAQLFPGKVWLLPRGPAAPWPALLVCGARTEGADVIMQPLRS